MASGFAVFAQDSTRAFDYNSKMGLKHYNIGVDIINSKGTAEANLDSIGEPAKTQFAIALRYLDKAYAIDPKNEKVLKALQGTHFSLSDNAKAERYRSELEALKKK
jgi:hypothetical protein